MNCLRPAFLALASIGLFVSSGISANLSPFVGKYKVAIKMQVNGVTYKGSGTAKLVSSNGRKGTLKVTSKMAGGQGTLFPSNSVLTLKGGSNAAFNDLTLGFTASPRYPGKGKSHAVGGRLNFKVKNAAGLKLSGVAIAPTKGSGKLSIKATINNAGLPGPAPYQVEKRTLVSAAVTHRYVLARPMGMAGALPLIVALHGDGGDGAGFRASLGLEDQLRGRAVVAYVDAIGGTFEYYTKAGRDSEAAVVNQLISDLDAAGLIRTDRVFLTGLSGGATMANAIGYRLGPVKLRGLGIMSGSLYSIGGDFPAQVPGNPTLPPAIIIWGQADHSDGTDYNTSGIPTRDIYLNAYQCAGITATSPSPTVIYAGNPADIWWCAVPGMAHALFPKAGEALWAYFSSRL